MDQFLQNLWKSSLICGIVVAIFLVFRTGLQKRYSAKARYWLWLALAVLLLLPVDYSLPQAPLAVELPIDQTVVVAPGKTYLIPSGTPVSSAGERDMPAAEPAVEQTNPSMERNLTAVHYVSLTMVIFGVYCLGVAVFLSLQGVGYAKFRTLMRRWSKDVRRKDYRQILQEEAARVHVREPRICVCEAVPTPLLMGFVSPMLLLPHEGYTEMELRLIVRHELYHLKRKDILYKLVLTFANAMHWFNPLVYLMLRQADEDIELSCDSAVAAGLDWQERSVYSETLLQAVQGKPHAVLMTTCFGSTVERLKQRITNVLGGKKKRGIAVAAGAVVLAVVLGFVISGTGKRDTLPENRYASMEAYAAQRIHDIKRANVVSYYALNENGDFEQREDTVEDVRVRQLECQADLEGIAAEGTLELWTFAYEVKPTDAQERLTQETFFPVDGNELTADGYITDGFFEVISVLRRADGYVDILGSFSTNDGYEIGEHGGEKQYLYDFYIDYAGLDMPKYLLTDFATTKGEEADAEVQTWNAYRYDGDGWYLYIPVSGWYKEDNIAENNWYSSYLTGASLSVSFGYDSVETMETFWIDQGKSVDRGDGYIRVATHEGMSNHVFYLYSAPEGGHYAVEIHWTYTGEVRQTEWGPFDVDQQLAKEAVLLEAMAQSFTIGNPFGLTNIVEEGAFASAIARVSTGSAAASLSLCLAEDVSAAVYAVQSARNTPPLDTYSYTACEELDMPGNTWIVRLTISNDDPSYFQFYEGTDVVSYHCGGQAVAYYEVSGTYDILGDEGGVLFDVVRQWYDEAEFFTQCDAACFVADTGQTWQEAAQEWLDLYEGAHLYVTSGSKYKYTWLKTKIIPADEEMARRRERGTLEDGEYCFYGVSAFVPENEDAKMWSTAGNTGDCDDPDAPEGALEYSRCCTIRLEEDGWHGYMGGTGW